MVGIKNIREQRYNTEKIMLTDRNVFLGAEYQAEVGMGLLSGVMVYIHQKTSSKEILPDKYIETILLSKWNVSDIINNSSQFYLKINSQFSFML